MSLASWQNDFRRWLLRGDVEDALAFGEKAAIGLNVYQNNYRTQLVRCLEVSYPATARWLGEGAFREAAIAHIDAHPPHGWTLDTYGKDFENTLFQLYPHNPDMHELAWIEWSLSEAFVASDANPMTRDALWRVDWEGACLQITPSLRLRSATTNADVLWHALQGEGMPSPEGELLDAPGGFLVWRREYTSRVLRIDAIEYASLRALQADPHFETMCEALVTRLGEEAGIARAGTLLAEWLDGGIVINTFHAL
ncbi:DNA-binding domain-containing protein [Luteibacter anthropi]|uniref:DUF2063 domain-containing protein n=1 Tax=Luteibacter anthropi TaxID=564369 RepID=A0A7X5UCH3_9GAMM|nr:DNA-binding domain-containing protein [Luteibacter anthropi]NII07949.1 DUF2063 domain-containing protein [Luteibacter anthropi]URX63486.1 DNA-binding domain-containing protein [Luteibacter anthropi]